VDGLGSIPPRQDSSVRHRVHSGPGTQPISDPLGSVAVSLGLMRPQNEADHSHPSSCKVNMREALPLLSYTSLRDMVFMY